MEIESIVMSKIKGGLEMSQSIKLEISNEDEIVLKLYEKLTEHLESIVKDSAIEGPLSQLQIAKFLTVSTDTIGSYEKLGMPYGHLGKRKFYDRKKCLEWQTSAKADELI